MTNHDIEQLSKLTDEAHELLYQAATKLQISAGRYMRTVKVSHTIADLDSSDIITPTHMAEDQHTVKSIT